MLFPYTYVPHQMEKMQEFIDFIFYEVWCKAPIGLVFHPDLFEGNPDLKEVIVEFGFSTQAAERGKAFYKDVKTIYELFALLSPQEIDQFKQWYQGNNDLEKVCANDPAAHLARYTDIAANHGDLADQLGIFFKDLYSRSLLDLAALRAKIGNIDDHYHAFMQSNKAGKCPFCGINDMKGTHHSKREAYDHYLPKALYPFNSINFRNLVPACHECNSSYKTSKDPAHNPAGRRKVFYPYSTANYCIEITIDFKKLDIDKLAPTDIEIGISSAKLHEEIETWKEVYGIDERYKAKCCSESDGKYWLEQVLDEYQENGRSPKEYMSVLTKSTERNPYAESNFLKKAFLEGCHRADLFS